MHAPDMDCGTYCRSTFPNTRRHWWVAWMVLALTPTLAADAQLVITAAPASVTVTSHSASVNAGFTLKNNGPGNSGLITLSCTSTGSAVCGSITPSGSPGLAKGVQIGVTINFSVGNPVSSSVTLLATSVSSGNGQGTQSITVNSPAGAPVVDLAPYLEAVQALGRCEVGCFAATHAQSTVPYVSLDAPRALTLAYLGDRVAPKAFVLVNVQPDQAFGTFPT